MSSGSEAPARAPERRRFPRVGLVVPVEVQGPRGGRWAVSSIDVSRDGMQLRCPQAQALAIVAECRQEGAAGQDVRVAVRFRVATGATPGSVVAARARVVYIRPVATDLVVMGIEFAGLDGADYDTLQAYIVESLRY